METTLGFEGTIGRYKVFPPPVTDGRLGRAELESEIVMKPVKALNHVGVAVRSIEQQRDYYEKQLVAEFECIEDVPSQKVRVAFFRINDVRLELLEPTDPSSPIAKFLEKRGRWIASFGVYGHALGRESTNCGNLACK